MKHKVKKKCLTDTVQCLTKQILQSIVAYINVYIMFNIQIPDLV